MDAGQKSFHDSEKKVVLKESLIYIESHYHFHVLVDG